MSLPGPNDPLLLLHNPRCSKSRAARELLNERGASVVERLYLDDPLTRAELEDLSARLGRPVADWVRKGEGAFQEAGLTADSSEDALLAAMAAHPILLERPILVGPDRAVVGRPTEELLKLL